jgi:endonuclease G
MFDVLRRLALVVCLLLVVVPSLLAGEGDEHLVMGNPSNATADEAKKDNYLIKRKQYALSYNNSNGTPNWVSWHVNKSWRGRVRRSKFAPDPDLPEGFFQVRPNDYRASGFDRGHMCPSGDRTASREDNQATFYMTNMVPQSPDNNRHTWEKLETYCRRLVRRGNELYIMAGPAGRGGWGENGFKTFLKGRQGNILVPGKTCKVVLVLPEGVTDPKKVTAEARTIAVIVPNIQGLDTAWRTYRCSVADVEQLTGYTFFSNVPEEVAKVIKARQGDEKKSKNQRSTGR